MNGNKKLRQSRPKRGDTSRDNIEPYATHDENAFLDPPPIPGQPPFHLFNNPEETLDELKASIGDDEQQQHQHQRHALLLSLPVHSGIDCGRVVVPDDAVHPPGAVRVRGPEYRDRRDDDSTTAYTMSPHLEGNEIEQATTDNASPNDITSLNRAHGEDTITVASSQLPHARQVRQRSRRLLGESLSVFEGQVIDEKHWCGSRRLWLLLAAVLTLVVIGVAVALTVILTQGSDSRSDEPSVSPTPPLTVAPSTPVPIAALPTISPTSVPDVLTELLSNVSTDGGVALSTMGTPQNKALVWLASNQFLEDYAEWKIIQRFSLATFYYGTSGEQWERQHLWMTDVDECVWPETVSMCNDDNRIKSLWMFSNNLNGTLPVELVLLNRLTQIDLGGSDEIRGTIPTEFGRLTDMLSLSVDSQLTGTIPTELGRLSNLARLRLASQLSGTLPTEIGQLTRLNALLLDQNRLDGTIPTQIGQFKDMEHLDLSFNSLTGQIPTEIGNMSIIACFRLSSNALTGQIPSEIGLMIDVRVLRLAFNRLTGTIPAEIGDWYDIDELLLNSNRLNGTVPVEFCSTGGSIIVNCPEVTCACDSDCSCCPGSEKCSEDYAQDVLIC